MCENCYNLKNAFEIFIERQTNFYKEIGLSNNESKAEAKKDLEQHLDSLPVIVSKNLYKVYKEIG